MTSFDGRPRWAQTTPARCAAAACWAATLGRLRLQLGRERGLTSRGQRRLLGGLLLGGQLLRRQLLGGQRCGVRGRRGLLRHGLRIGGRRVRGRTARRLRSRGLGGLRLGGLPLGGRGRGGRRGRRGLPREARPVRCGPRGGGQGRNRQRRHHHERAGDKQSPWPRPSHAELRGEVGVGGSIAARGRGIEAGGRRIGTVGGGICRHGGGGAWRRPTGTGVGVVTPASWDGGRGGVPCRTAIGTVSRTSAARPMSRASTADRRVGSARRHVVGVETALIALIHEPTPASGWCRTGDGPFRRCGSRYADRRSCHHAASANAKITSSTRG